VLSNINADTMGYILAFIEYIGALILFISVFSARNLSKEVRKSVLINASTLALIATATIMNRYGDTFIRISSFFYLAASGLFVISAQIFHRLKPRYFLAFLPIFIALGVYLFPDLRDSFVARSRVNTSQNAVLSMWVAYLYAFHNREGLVSARLLATVFALGATSYFVLFSGSFIQSGAWVEDGYQSIVFKYNYFLLLLVILSLAPLMLALMLEHNSTKYKRLARIDSLTGIRNRRAFFDDAEHALTKPGFGRSADDARFAAAVLDIDHFKSVNDQYGHAAGDKVIVHLAALMQQVIGKRGVYGRTGGEEFSVFILNAEKDEAAELLDKLRLTFAASANGVIGIPEKITLSVGVYSSDQASSSLEHAIGKADEALYRAKRMGRNRLERQDAQTCELLAN